jgi:hypothetical protein
MPAARERSESRERQLTPEEELDGDDDETGAAADEADVDTRGKRRKTNGERALTNVRVAKRSVRGIELPPLERARLLLAEASVLAMLDLAATITGD